MSTTQLIRPGDRIQHPAYGIGTVRKVWRFKHELIAQVAWVRKPAEVFTVVLTPKIVVVNERSL